MHFPGFYLPPGEFDQDKLKHFVQQVRESKASKPPDYARVMNSLNFALNRDHLKEFCVFSDNPEGMNAYEEQKARELGFDITRAIKEVPPTAIDQTSPNWTEFHLENGVMRLPSGFEYPANALLYAKARGISILNDDPGMPVPAVQTDNSSAELSAILAAECLKLALPAIPHLSIVELAQIRQELRQPLVGFRNAMVKLSKDLDDRIRGGDEPRSIQKHAKRLIETTVAPMVSDLEIALSKPAQPWIQRAMDAAKTVPDLVVAFSTLSPTTLSKTAGQLASLLFATREAQSRQLAEAKRTGLYYILQLREREKLRRS